MRLKPIVASMIALGVASAPAFANGVSSQSSSAFVDHANAIVNTNSARVYGAPGFALSKYLTVNGLVNVDFTYSSNTPSMNAYPGWGNVFFGSNDYTNVNVHNANLFFSFNPNDWVHGYLNVGYLADRFRTGDKSATAVIPTGGFAAANVGLLADEAYLQLSDFDQSPFYLKAGKYYVPFGVYQRYTISDSLPKQLSQTRATAIQIGFVTPFEGGNNIVYGSVYGFNGPTDPAAGDVSNHIRNWGFNLGLSGFDSTWTYRFDGSWIRRMSDVDAVFYANPGSGGAFGSTVANVSGYALHAGVSMEPFGIYGNYVSATSNLAGANTEPSAWEIYANYDFDFGGYPSTFGFGYQAANSDGAGIVTGAGTGGTYLFGGVESRWLFNYTLKVWKNTSVALEYRHDTQFDETAVNRFLTDRDANTFVARLSTQF